MPEIRSTLDLIMEKTKNFSLTEEERREIRRKELDAKVRGWTQRYLDGLIDEATLEQEMAGMPDEQETVRELLQKSAMAHIDPEGDHNERIYRLLENILGLDAQPLAQRIESFHSEWAAQEACLSEEILQELHAKGIGGSAVVPNIEAHPRWQSLRKAALESFTQRLETKDADPSYKYRNQ